MEKNTNKRKGITLLMTATIGVMLLLGATACNDNNDNNGSDVVVEDNGPDVVVPSDTGSVSPSPSASASQ